MKLYCLASTELTRAHLQVCDSIPLSTSVNLD